MSELRTFISVNSSFRCNLTTCRLGHSEVRLEKNMVLILVQSKFEVGPSFGDCGNIRSINSCHVKDWILVYRQVQPGRQALSPSLLAPSGRMTKMCHKFAVFAYDSNMGSSACLKAFRCTTFMNKVECLFLGRYELVLLTFICRISASRIPPKTATDATGQCDNHFCRNIFDLLYSRLYR